MLAKNSVQKTIPWRANWNENSLSTPCRFAFDASQQTDSNTNLGEISAKGKNNMSKLIESWSAGQFIKLVSKQTLKRCITLFNCKKNIGAFIGTYSKMSQTTVRYLQISDQDIFIYDVTSSGIQSEREILETARMSAVEFPELNHIIQKDIYVNDGLSSAQNVKDAMIRADSVAVKQRRFFTKRSNIQWKIPIIKHQRSWDEMVTKSGFVITRHQEINFY